MTNLIEDIASLYGHPTALAVEQYFDSMAMPVPQDNEYTTTTDNGFLLFLDDYGCVKRITSEEFPHLRHSRILQPLSSRKAEKVRIETNPGIICPTTDDDAATLADFLFQDNVKMPAWEMHAYNCGGIPYFECAGKEDFLVLMESTAALKMQGFVEADDAALRQSPQGLLYGYLRKAFEDAWPAGQKKADAAKLKQVWSQCAQAKERGALKTGWLHMDSSIREVYQVEGGAAYARRWSPVPCTV